MAGSRLELVFGGTPPEGRLLLVGARAGTDLDHFDPARTQVVQGFYPDHQALRAQGHEVATSASGD
ncbi:MAG TPA: MFS transporter, partial [Paracoccus sp. (in: a-proteobacteria)]|nr:MFS transporter [Paracoccus sp. (in: a-proteobacteria)]